MSRSNSSSPLQIIYNNRYSGSISSMASLSHSESSEFLSEDEINDNNTPRSMKLVNICKNCDHSFRVSSSRTPSSMVLSSEFCTMDCQTCFTFFKGPEHMSASEQRKAIKDVKESIFMFQNQLDSEDERNYSPAPKKAKGNGSTPNHTVKPITAVVSPANDNVPPPPLTTPPLMPKTSGKTRRFQWPSLRSSPVPVVW